MPFDKLEFIDNLENLNKLIGPNCLQVDEIVLTEYGMIEVGSPVLIDCILIHKLDDELSARLILQAVELV
jgi:hypothetical protein